LDLKSNWYLNASAGSSPARGTSLHLFSGEGFFYVCLLNIDSRARSLSRQRGMSPAMF